MDEIDIIFEQLKDNYPLVLTNTLSLDQGFTINTKIICGESPAGSFWLYDDGCQLVFSVESKTQEHSHWHPFTASEAIRDVIQFMKGACPK